MNVYTAKCTLCLRWFCPFRHPQVNLTFKKPVLNLNLYDTTGEEDIFINQVLVDTGIAVFVEDAAQETGKVLIVKSLSAGFVTGGNISRIFTSFMRLNRKGNNWQVTFCCSVLIMYNIKCNDFVRVLKTT